MMERVRSINSPLVSVVIITRDREKEVQRCLSSIRNSTYKNVELVVVDNSSGDKTKSLLFPMATEGKLKYIRSLPVGLAKLRQIAVDNSRGEIIMNIDDDCIVEENAISQVVKRFLSDEKIGIVGGHLTNVGFEGESQFKGRGRIGVAGRYELVRDFQEAEIFGSADMSISRKVFDAIGGYDPFLAVGLEEADLTLRVKKKGYKVVYEPSVKVTHFRSPTRFINYRTESKYRLYIFFKHYMPRKASDWIQFLKSELRLLSADLSRLIPKPAFVTKKNDTGDRSIAKRNLSKYFLAMANIFTSFLLAIICRAIIPLLIYGAYKRRKLEKQKFGIDYTN